MLVGGSEGCTKQGSNGNGASTIEVIDVALM
ncbi:hypothetical protein ACVIGB_008521 [Bradyrhizobium sp. USDA 4341]